MNLRDATFAATAILLALSGAAGIAASGAYVDGNAAVRAEYVGFDALAQRMFGGGRGCPPEQTQ